MNKNAKQGLLTLLLWACFLTLLAFVFFGREADFPPFRSLFRAVPLLLAGFYVLVFLSLKGSRLRMLLLLASGAALGLFLSRLHLSWGQLALAALGVSVLYVSSFTLLHYRRLRKDLQPLNEAALAYREDRDGGKYLAALDRCAGLKPRVGVFTRPDAGTVTYQEHILCEKIQVLIGLGRLEECRALIEQARRGTESPDLLRWLDEREAELASGGESVE